MTYKRLQYLREVQVGAKEIPMVKLRGDVTVASRKALPFELPWVSDSSGVFATSGNGPNVSLSNGNRTAVLDKGSTAFGAAQKTTGKWYLEMETTSFSSGIYPAILGMASSATSNTDPWLSSGELLIYYDFSVGVAQVIHDHNQRINLGAGTHIAAGDYIGLAVDFDAAKASFSINGVTVASNLDLTTLITSYSAGMAFKPSASNPQDTSTSAPCTVNYPAVPKYLPSGYQPW